LSRHESSHLNIEEQVTIERRGSTVRRHYAGRPCGAPFRRLAAEAIELIRTDLRQGLSYEEIGAKWDVPAEVIREFDLHG
jgi:hypothetical protein